MNIPWAIKQLDVFIKQTTPLFGRSSPEILSMAHPTSAFDYQIVEQSQVVEKILDRVVPDWRNLEVAQLNRWDLHHEAAIRAKVELERKEEIEQNLGENVPVLSANQLHSWIWSGASSLWQSGHYREAVESAVKKLNAETQNRLRRRDVSETELFQQAFSTDAPVPDKPRLRRIPDDGSQTYKSVQRGAMSLAGGIFAGIRNPLSHETDQELSEQEALEYLAVLSVLARWVANSQLEKSNI